MGKVWRAHHTGLKRDDALKVLPDAFASDPDRLARFRREAQVLASLNHPNIAHVHGLEQADDVQALVMELVEGPTLADRIARGPIPVDEALPIAKQIAEALEAAHEQGIIHRDLKPANIKVRSDGAVKVLDFGLAKALEPASAADVNTTTSPTITSPAIMTGVGVLLGTAAYMSPEQARGKSVDKRADIWSFGCVLYEMLAGARAFPGDDVTDTLANVLKTQPDWQSLPLDTPSPIRRLLRRCLTKSLKDRVSDASMLRIEVEEARVGIGDGHDRVGEARTAGVRSRRRYVPLIAAVALGALASGAIVWGLRPAPTALPVRRFTIPIPGRADVATTADITDIAVSPDGRTVVLARTALGLVKRNLDDLSFEPVRGGEGGLAPFFSPDGAWIGFRADGKLKKIPVEGGLAITICEVPASARATWGEDGSIAVAWSGDLYRVPSSGGTPQLLLKADGPGYFQPQFVPGTDLLLVRTLPVTGRIEVIDLRTRTAVPLIDGTSPQVAATGHLVFERDGGIWAASFDATRSEAIGAPVLVAESVHRTIGGQALFATARDGSLVYVGGSSEVQRSLVWLDRTGKTAPALDAQGPFQSPRLSPDGQRVVVSVLGSTLDLWSYEFERGTRMRLTTRGNNRRTVWSPDGGQIAFYSTPTQGGEQDLYVMPSTGGESKRLLARPGLQFPDTWSPDGRFLVFEDGEGGGGARRDLWLLPFGEQPKPLLVTEFDERGAVFSPDGRWLAFVTDETGRPEVYVQPFPGLGPRIAVSTSGGSQPVWARDGRELFYREGDWLMAAAIQLDPFRIAAQRRLFEFPAHTYNLDANFADYDVSPDGRFLAIRNDSSAPREIHVILNWTEELKRLVPTN